VGFRGRHERRGWQGKTLAVLAGGVILLLLAAAAVGSRFTSGQPWQRLVQNQAAPASATAEASPSAPSVSPATSPSYVVSNQTDNAGAVKTYPNVHKDYRNQAISSFGSLASSFAATGPKTGIYNIAYDIWINGIAASGSTEIMIWTDNYKQVPAGSKVRTVTLSGRSYDVWKTSNNRYIAFVVTSTVTAGTVNLLEILKYPIGEGWLGAGATLGQICYGVEIVSTGGVEQTFDFTDFSISS
jgi:hypothetical protein